MRNDSRLIGGPPKAATVSAQAVLLRAMLLDAGALTMARDPFSADDVVTVCEVCQGVEGHAPACLVGHALEGFPRIAQVLYAFYQAPLSAASLQPVLDLAVQLNPELGARHEG